MDADICDRAFYDDGECVSWSEVEEQLRYHEWRAKYPNADTSLIPYFEELLSLAESYHLQTGRHLNVYGDIGELFGAITYGIKLNRSYAQGADGRLGNDHVEIKTITPFKSKDEVFVKVSGNFSKLLVVKINADFEVSSRMVDRKKLRKTAKSLLRIKWSDLPHDK
ncbi:MULTISPECIES: hypothetical protein [Rhizobium]|uniref:hypothetical protein n=1 Tax=Rhizobium TaxID=379 RepID=UPI001C83146C|nr:MULTISPECIES: hypothetical protein [Rhizobium]MBX4899416.1 hypothetical protein [Rhizobium bangladeshense]MBX5297402.1 hypothetical protein [Rhizobium sp. NLR15a]MBY3617629.1 hypothetical protein [Rhizobium bangladeshense]